MRSTEPTVAAIVREQTGAAWSRARDLCTEGRVTVNGQRCLDPALRAPSDAVVVVDERAPKLHTGALPESAIAFFDRDVVVVDKPDGMLGSYGHFRRPRGAIPPDARRSVTHVTPIAPLAGATLVECRLETGRQHQIRIHMSELGHPLVGERVYIRDYAGRT